MNIENGQPLTSDQIKEMENARSRPIVFGVDCGELSEAMMKAFRSAVIQRDRRKKV